MSFDGRRNDDCCLLEHPRGIFDRKALLLLDVARGGKLKLSFPGQPIPSK